MKFIKKNTSLLKKITSIYIAFPPLSLLLSGKVYLVALFIIYILGYELFSNPIIIVWSIFTALNRLAIIIGVLLATDAEYEEWRQTILKDPNNQNDPKEK